MQARARQADHRVLNPAYAKHLAFYRTTMLPHCAKSDSVSAQPGGAAYYAFRVRQETTTDLTPEQIHDIGLARDRPDPRRDGQGRARRPASPPAQTSSASSAPTPIIIATTPRELMAGGGADRQDDRRQDARPVRPAAAAHLRRSARSRPRRPRARPPLITARARRRAGIAGTYYVNTSKLDQRPLWELPALTAARGGARPSPPDRAPAGARSAALPPQLHLLHRLHRGLGALFGEPRRGDGPLRHAGEEDGPALLPGVARGAAGGRHRHPFEGLGQGAGGRLHARQYGA